VCLTAGGSTRRTGWNAHQSAPLRLAEVAALSFDHTAPADTQSRMETISASDSLRPGGIFRSPDCSMARTRRLSPGVPGLIAAPRLPPLMIDSRFVTDRPLDLSESLWHGWQVVLRIRRALALASGFSGAAVWPKTGHAIRKA